MCAWKLLKWSSDPGVAFFTREICTLFRVRVVFSSHFLSVCFAPGVREMTSAHFPYSVQMLGTCLRQFMGLFGRISHTFHVKMHLDLG